MVYFPDLKKIIEINSEKSKVIHDDQKCHFISTLPHFTHFKKNIYFCLYNGI